jgi:hypothetical protein
MHETSFIGMCCHMRLILIPIQSQHNGKGQFDPISDATYLHHALSFTVQTLKRALESPLPRGCKHSFSEFVLSCVLPGLVTGLYLMSTNRPEKCGKRGDRIDLQHHRVLFKWKLKEEVDCVGNLSREHSRLINVNFNAMEGLIA